MRTFSGLLLSLVLSGFAAAQVASSAAPAAAADSLSPTVVDAGSASLPKRSNAQPAAPGTAIVSVPSAADIVQAKRDFSAGLRLKNSGKLDRAFEKFQHAAELSPRSVDYLTAREFARQQLVMEALERGNQAMLEKNDIVAMAQFRQALQYDPTNDFALQRLHDSLSVSDKPLSRNLRMVEKSEEIHVQPTGGDHDFHYRGDARTLLTEIAKAYGVSAIVDDSVQPRRVRFDIEDVNFETAMEAATRVTKTFWVALSGKQIFVVGDTAENRRTFERMSIRTFYLPDVSTPQELNEITNALRVLLDLRFVVQDAAASTVTIRAPQSSMQIVSEIAEQMLENFNAPEVLLDVRVYQISYSLLRQLGTQLPTQFTMFNISPALIASLGQNAQNLINQLIASGGINQANSQAIQALLTQLQQSSQNSLLSNPFATFGGGLTLMGLEAGGPATANFKLNQSDVRNLEHVWLRASQNKAAVLKVGERYPIVNATFAPIYNTSSISKVISNQSYIAPFPSFNFEDLGFNLKATPVIHSDTDVTLKLEMQIRSLGATNVNGIPIINNREYSGSITVKNGEAGVVAGLVSKSDSRSISGYPFLSRVPGVNYGFAEHEKNVTGDDLLVVITPQILRMPNQNGIAMQLPTGH